MSRKRSDGDERQLMLFGSLPAGDPVQIYYDKVKKIGAWLAVNPTTKYITIERVGHIPQWASFGLARHRVPIREDLMRDIYGVRPPALDRRNLEGGAELVRLRPRQSDATRRSPPIDPPSRQPTRRPLRDDDPGAA